MRAGRDGVALLCKHCSAAYDCRRGPALTRELYLAGGPAFISCNSVGGLAGLQAAINAPELVRGVQVINISLRGLHVKRQQPWLRPLVAAFQRLLRETSIGAAFFGNVATPRVGQLCAAQRLWGVAAWRQGHGWPSY